MRFTTKMLAASAAFVLATGTMTPRADAAPLPTAAVVASAPAVSLTAPAAVFAPVQEGAKIEITTNDRRSSPWYTSPVWIAIGVIALVLIITLIVMAGRGRDTTVVK